MSSKKEDGIIVILSSPSGTGKTTLVKILAEKKNFFISISHTTRKPRSNETHSEDYFFVNQEEFQLLIKKNEFLEYAKVFNNFYGTTKTPIISNLQKGKNIIFDIDWQGTKQIKEKKLNYKLITFFILPPSKKILFERLTNRHMKDQQLVEERMKQFGKDVLHWLDYDYVVINDDLNNCFNEVNNLIKAEINNTSNSYNAELIKKHVEGLIN